MIFLSFLLSIIPAPECPLQVSGVAEVYMVAIYAHESPVHGVRYTFTTEPQVVTENATLTPSYEGHPIGFEWWHKAPDFQKSTDVLVKSCGGTDRVYPFIFSDGFETGTTERWE